MKVAAVIDKPSWLFPIRELCFFTACLLTFTMLNAQQKVIPLYEGTAPGSENWNWQEKEFFVKVPLNAKVVYNVSKPTLTVFSPDVPNGCAVIICPGGGFRVLNFENEGITVANKLVEKGITVFVLKYRLVQSVTTDPWQETMDAVLKQDSISRKKAEVVREMAMDDLNAALLYVRQHAMELKIDPKRIGVLGFSAGGVITAKLAYNFTPETRPDFAASIYAVIPSIKDKMVKADAPPLFIAAATDDSLARVSNSIDLYNDWKNAKRSVELHLYSSGGHGLHGSIASQNWILRFEEWLDGLGFLISKQ